MTVPTRALAALLLVLAALAVPAADALAQQQRSGTVRVTGHGAVAAVPDMASVEAGVETVAATAAEALADNTARMAEVFATLGEAGIAERDMRTADFRIVPVTADRQRDGDGAPAVTGYRVENAVLARVRDLRSLGPLLDRLVGSGANRIRSIRFEIAAEEELLAEARRQAVENAIGKAELYAEAAGIVLGPVIGIDDAGGGIPRPAELRAMPMDAASVPIAAGETSVTASVVMTWRIGGN